LVRKRTGEVDLLFGSTMKKPVSKQLPKVNGYHRISPRAMESQRGSKWLAGREESWGGNWDAEGKEDDEAEIRKTRKSLP
jgi:hypothetical protein